MGKARNDDHPAVDILIYDGSYNMCDGCEGKQGAEKVGCAGVETEVPFGQRDGERERMLEWADGPVEARD